MNVVEKVLLALIIGLVISFYTYVFAYPQNQSPAMGRNGLIFQYYFGLPFSYQTLTSESLKTSLRVWGQKALLRMLKGEPETSEIRLDIGCGNKKRQGFIGLDTRPTLQTDYVCSLQETHKIFPYGTVDEIYSRRVIQHIPDDAAALKEIVKLLKAGGSATIIVSGWRAWLYYQLWWKHMNQNIYPCFHLYTKGQLGRKLVKNLSLADYLRIDWYICTTREGCRAHSFDVVLKISKKGREE